MHTKVYQNEGITLQHHIRKIFDEDIWYICLCVCVCIYIYIYTHTHTNVSKRKNYFTASHT